MWVWPTESQPLSYIFIVSGMDDWIAIAVSLDKAIIMVKIVSRSKNVEDSVEEPMIGAQAELEGFCNGTAGTSTLRLASRGTGRSDMRCRIYTGCPW